MRFIFPSKTNNAFYQTILMVAVAIGAMFFLSVKAYQISSLYIEVLVHRIKDACGCENMTQFFSMHPDIFRAVILFAVGIGIFALYSLYKLANLISRTKKYTRHYLSFAKSEHSMKLKSAVKSLGLDNARIVEIEKSDLAAFCFGFWQPKICISSELIELLSKKELKAVLIHEAHHMKSHEPLKIFIVKYFKSTFFFLPGIKTSVNKYCTFSELAADEKVSKTIMGRAKLASAILKISEREEYKWRSNNASLSFFSSTIYDRVNWLSDETYVPTFKFLDKSLIVGSLGLAISSVLFIFVFSSSTRALEMHNIAGCVNSVGPGSDLTCDNLEKNQNILRFENDFFPTINNNSGQDSTCKSS